MNSENNWNPCNSIGLLSDCDVVLTNGDQQCIGLKYDEKYCNAPYPTCKGQPGINTYQRKIVEAMGIPCVENKALVRSLFDNADEGEQLPQAYWSAVAAIYSKLPKIEKQNEETDFERQLREDIQKEIYMHEKNTYDKVIRKFKKMKPDENNFEGNVAGYFEEEIRNLTADYGLNTRSYHNAVLKTDEFYLETYYEKFDIKFRQMIFVAEREQQIFIGTRTLFMSFSFIQAQTAMKFLQLLIKTCNEELMPIVKVYCEEFDINPKIYEIVSNSIKAIVELNYKLTGMEYGVALGKTKIGIVLKKQQTEDLKRKPRMLMITITYKEYLRSPEEFKEFLKNPKPREQWNFWCREQKYNPEYFDEKFQTVTT